MAGINFLFLLHQVLFLRLLNQKTSSLCLPLFFFIVLGGGILWHLQKFLQYVKYLQFYLIILKKIEIDLYYVEYGSGISFLVLQRHFTHSFIT
jgi:hypothetical protein